MVPVGGWPAGGFAAGPLCCGEKSLLKGRTVTAQGRFPECGLLGGPWRGVLCLRGPGAVPGRAAARPVGGTAG